MANLRPTFVLLFIVLGLTPASAAFSGGKTEVMNAVQPQLAVGNEGRVWLAYGRLTEAPPTPPVDHAAHASGAAGQKKTHQPPVRSGEIFVAASSDIGVTFAPAVRVATLPKVMLGMRRGPRLVARGEQLTLTVMGEELFAFTSTNGGQEWSGPVRVNDVPTAAREGLHDLAVAPSGELFLTWLDLRNGTMELWSASSRDAGKTWSKNTAVYKSPDKSICECCHPSALFDADGNLAVMWRNSINGARDMWLAVRTAGRAEFDAPRKLGEGTWNLNACPMDGGRIVALGAGKFGAVWQRAGDIFFVPASGTETKVASGRQPVAMGLEPHVLFAWQQGADLVALRGNSGGPPRTIASDARFPVLVPVTADTTLIAYERGPAKGTVTVVVERL